MHKNEEGNAVDFFLFMLFVLVIRINEVNTLILIAILKFLFWNQI